MPPLKSNEETEQFVVSADLSEFDLSGFASVKFELEPKSVALNMRLTKNLPNAVKTRAEAEGMPHTRYIRFVLEQAITRD